ncbi:MULTISPECIES: hypothetical protein [unclassified Colwellia]|jgi:hypothetical protein|uniref:hypothetical protein n=1 Tax=unclassified Colwellia TaxID=196834 RepID=UPI0015F77F08|nr:MULTISPECIES: hypothetical protein [unclassified Colwellia]MBA6348285.1 hypothetical protein [Colwellia sp. BRX8-9]MBA6381337.1 hypothetical protein [Colwellia sp. BRX10-7]MBA6389085.1 hypothetical protein [Colwellia sp. BRX10-2]MBA6403809.1 hypothetical protein [Colwellia sp. BRX10-5]MBA6407687.1 hypothetical protein [Colwellia sp. BRX10-1]
MQNVFLLSLTIMLLGCFSSKAEEQQTPTNFEKLDQVLSHTIFQKNSKITLNIIEPCKAEFISEWSSEVSKRKGFYSVKTFVLVDFKNNFKNTTFTSAHVTSEDGHSYQSWGDVIDLNLFENSPVKKVVLMNSNSDESVSSYNTDYISIGVGEPENYDKISELLKVIDLVSSGCKSL